MYIEHAIIFRKPGSENALKGYILKMVCAILKTFLKRTSTYSHSFKLVYSDCELTSLAGQFSIWQMESTLDIALLTCGKERDIGDA